MIELTVSIKDINLEVLPFSADEMSDENKVRTLVTMGYLPIHRVNIIKE